MAPYLSQHTADSHNRRHAPVPTIRPGRVGGFSFKVLGSIPDPEDAGPGCGGTMIVGGRKPSKQSSTQTSLDLTAHLKSGDRGHGGPGPCLMLMADAVS